MRVAILITDLITNGGAPRQAMLLARWLQAFGHDATLYAVRYCPENCFPEIAASLDIRAVHRLSAADVRRRNRGRHHGIASGAPSLGKPSARESRSGAVRRSESPRPRRHARRRRVQAPYGRAGCLDV